MRRKKRHQLQENWETNFITEFSILILAIK